MSQLATRNFSETLIQTHCENTAKICGNVCLEEADGARPGDLLRQGTVNSSSVPKTSFRN